MDKNTVGFIEVVGLATAIEAADAAVKTGKVKWNPVGAYIYE